MQTEIKNKFDTFAKLAFYISIGAIITQGLLKLIFKVDWFDLQVNQNIANFYLFKNVVFQGVISQISLMFTYIIAISISSKALIKDVIKISMPILIFTYLLNFADPELVFIITPLSYALINIQYAIATNTDLRNKVRSTVFIIIISLIVGLYQYVVMLIRYNDFNIAHVESFYEGIILSLDMHILSYFVYRIRKNKGGVS